MAMPGDQPLPLPDLEVFDRLKQIEQRVIAVAEVLTPPGKAAGVWMTVAEIADELRVSKMTVYRLISDGQLKASRFGRSIRVLRTELDSYIQVCVASSDEATA